MEVELFVAAKPPEFVNLTIQVHYTYVINYCCNVNNKTTFLRVHFPKKLIFFVSKVKNMIKATDTAYTTELQMHTNTDYDGLGSTRHSTA